MCVYADAGDNCKDFKKHFRNMDICHRSRGIRDVRLDVHEVI